MVYYKKFLLLSVVLLFIGSAQTFSQVINETISDTSKSDFSYNFLDKTFSKIDKISIGNKENLIKELEKINFVNGTVYFSGAGFTNVIAVAFTGGVRGLTDYLDRCVAGSQITFDPCRIKNNDGSIIKDFKKAILFY